MIELYSYDPQFDEELQDWNEKIYLELKFHQDVMRDTAVAALMDDELVGVAYLMKSPSFLVLDRDLPYYHVNMEFFAFPQEDPEIEVEVSAYLLGYLMDAFTKLQESMPEKHLILRTFVSSEDTSYLDFLSSLGFTASRVMLRMEKDLVFDPEEELPEVKDVFQDSTLEISKLDLQNEDEVQKYFAGNEEAFMVPDSMGELSHRITHCMAGVYLLKKADEIVSSVSLWNSEAPEIVTVPGQKISTENIFTAPKYQQKGYAEYLLTYLHQYLAKKDASKVTLNVYADDTPAICLYQKLEYETISEIFEMHFDLTPTYMPY